MLSSSRQAAVCKPFSDRWAPPAFVCSRVVGLASAAAVASALLSGLVHAGPPFLTDDPEPVELHHSEFYLFSTYDEAGDGKDVAIPAFEYNYGALPDLQLHVAVAFVRTSPRGGSSMYGLGDTEVGVKYRFVEETDTMPQVGTFPMAELDTGDAREGLGNGKTWWRLPVWIQKSWGHWLSYGGLGYVLNRAPGQKDYPFAGWLIQNDLSPKLSLGGEIFGRGEDTEDGRPTTLVDLGGFYRFTPAFNLLFSVGHSVSGENHRIAYLGLWWTWGEDPHTGGSAPRPSGQEDWSLTRER
jgi:hypothetical protein